MRNVKMAICLVVLIVTITARHGFGEIVHLRNGVTWDITWEIGDHVHVDQDVASSIQTTVNWFDGAVTSRYYAANLRGYNNSQINIYGGMITGYLQVYDYSTLNLYNDFAEVDPIYGGIAGGPGSHNYSTINVFDGYVGTGFASYNYSTANMSGGSVGRISFFDYSIANITGGQIDYLHTSDFSTVTFYGRNFFCGSGLTLDGNRVLGTGILSGEWLDGTLWTMDINENYSTATILAIPEPATLLLLGLGVVILRSKR